MQEPPAQPPSLPGPITFHVDFGALAQSIADALGAWLTAFAYGLPEIAAHNTLTWARQAVVSIVTADSSANVLIHNPLHWIVNDTTIGFHNSMLGGQLALTVLVVAFGAIRIVFGLTDEWEVLLKTGLLVLIGSTMHLWFPGVLAFINARAGEVATLAASPVTGGEVPAGLEVVAMILVALWFAFKACLKGLVGVVFLGVLYIVGPFVILLGAIPMFTGLAEWWAGHTIAWALRPFFVALVLRLGLGIGLQVSDLHMQVLAAIAAFWLADHLPDWLASSRLSAGVWGSIGQMQLVSRAAGALGSLAGAPLAAGARALRGI